MLEDKNTTQVFFIDTSLHDCVASTTHKKQTNLS